MRPTKEIIEPHWNDIFDRDRAILSLQNENDCFVAMKEGVGVRIAGLEAKIERLQLQTQLQADELRRRQIRIVALESGND